MNDKDNSAPSGEADKSEGVMGLQPYEFYVAGKSLRWYLKHDVDALLAERAQGMGLTPVGKLLIAGDGERAWYAGIPDGEYVVCKSENLASQPAQGVGLTEDTIFETIMLFRRAGEGTPFGLETAQRCARVIFGKAQSAILARQPAPTPARPLAMSYAEAAAWAKANGYNVPPQWEATPPPPFAAPASQHDANGRAAVPEGFVIVPKEPTGVMKDAGAFSGAPLACAHPWVAAAIYRAMLAAAPAPAPVAQEGKALDSAHELTLENAPLGTKAPAINGGYWIRVERGWKWCTGSTFPRPGGDWNGTLIAPDSALAAAKGGEA